ncbi:MAG: radical SAM protein [Candidatus Buchananbacteria bacterium]|nr:radical SAM protein [Candidatus Buchananbacteria bacterium]
MTLEKGYKNIVLIEPPTGEKEITSFKYPPMGLLALATYLDKHGYNIKLIDASVDNLSVEELMIKIKDAKPDLVGISVMSVNVLQTFNLADEIKKYNPDIKVIVGGIHPTVMPDHTLSNKNIDIAVIGEGELTVIELLEALKNNQDLSQVRGLAFRQGEEIITTIRRPLITNLDELPIPLYHLFDIKKYKSPYAKRMPFISIVRSRGCFYSCTFCGNPKMFGQTFRCQSPERTVAEIDYLVNKFGIKEISFKDTELTLDKNLEKLCDLLIAKNYDLIWTCNGRVNNVSESLLKKMKRAGCYSITFGIESGNQEILNRMKKGITLDQVKKAVDLAKREGLQIVTNFMIGNAYDSKETIEQTIDFAVALDTDYAYFGFTTPFPGTELREQATINNWIIDHSMEAIRYDDLMMNATSMPTEELKTYLDKAYGKY